MEAFDLLDMQCKKACVYIKIANLRERHRVLAERSLGGFYLDVVTQNTIFSPTQHTFF